MFPQNRPWADPVTPALPAYPIHLPERKVPMNPANQMDLVSLERLVNLERLMIEQQE